MKRNIGKGIFVFAIHLALAGVLSAAPKWMQRRQLSRHREIWQARKVTDYRYQVSIAGDWGANSLMPLTMLYQNGQLVSVVDVDGNVLETGWDTLAGIDAVFQEVQVSLAKKKRDVTEIQYDPTYGFLSHADIYYHETGVGAEYSRRYTVKGF